MPSLRPNTFEYIDRGHRNSIVLIPGWASDYRIFGRLNLDFNYLLPTSFSPNGFTEALRTAMEENNLSGISLFGWSLGGFAAQGFAIRYPELVDRLILVSIRSSYDRDEISKMKDQLKKNRIARLYKFYTQSFPTKGDMRSFRETLLKPYLEEFKLDYLLETLDYLAEARIKTRGLSIFKTMTIMHGDSDRIAPIEEALQIKSQLPQAEFITIKGAGHIPFYR